MAESLFIAQPDFAGWLVGSLRCGVVAADADGAIAVLNEQAHQILGCPEGDPSAALGRCCREVFAARPAVVRLLLDALDGRERPARAELVLGGAEADEAAATIGFTVTTVRDADGRIRGSALLFRDLAPIEAADERARLDERLAALGQMAAGLAHEIRNPLAGMEVIVGLLKRRVAGHPEALSLVEDLTGELRSLTRVVNDSLDYVRPARPVRQPVDLKAVLEHALQLARARVAFEGEVMRAFAPSLPACLADPDQMLSLVSNLIGNALEAMSGQGGGPPPVLRLGLELAAAAANAAPIRVDDTRQLPASDARTARAGAGDFVISVSDTGPGVPESLRSRIYDPFFTTKAGGSGVGLATVQKIVTSHGGQLELESPPPFATQGSLFRVRLPGPGSAG